MKVTIGGRQIDAQIQEYTGADAYGKDAMTAVRSWHPAPNRDRVGCHATGETDQPPAAGAVRS